MEADLNAEVIKLRESVKTEFDDAIRNVNSAMAQLNRDKEELTTMKNNLDAAIVQGSKAIANHIKDRKDLQTKV